MKTLVVAILSVLSVLPDQQETISEIKVNSTLVRGSISNTVYQQDRTQFKEFISILNQNELKNAMLSTTYCLDFQPDYNGERSMAIKYDRNDKIFPISNEVYHDLFFDDPQYIQIDQFLFRCPDGIKVRKKNINYACVDMIAETILFEITDKDLASEIEKNRNDLRLLFVFKITGTTTLPGKTEVTAATDYYLMTSLQKLVVYNHATEKIYSVYK